ncbi:hypothetical protein [Streptomyces sp. NBC_00046]|uniref:hypothetical protein n=1 Tax=unclassified Streptomyces TaxID=2593676 RepID=UPI0032439665
MAAASSSSGSGPSCLLELLVAESGDDGDHHLGRSGQQNSQIGEAAFRTLRRPVEPLYHLLQRAVVGREAPGGDVPASRVVVQPGVQHRAGLWQGAAS